MLVVDSQVHLWSGSPSQPHPDPAFRLGYGAGELLAEMKTAGVHRAVLVPLTANGDSDPTCRQASQSHPQQFSAMGACDLAAPRQIILSVAQGTVGLRFNLRHEQPLICIKEHRAEALFKLAEDMGTPLAFFVLHPHMPVIASVAERYPGMKIVLDHLGIDPTERDEHAYRNIGALLEMARHPNVMVKLSALPCTSSEAYPFRRIHPFIRMVFDAFGPERLFWGSDLTRTKKASGCTYRQMVTLITEELPWLSQADKESIMGKSLCRWLNWA